MELWNDICIANASSGTRACIGNATETIEYRCVDFYVTLFTLNEQLSTVINITKRIKKYIFYIYYSLLLSSYSNIHLNQVH